MTLKQLKDKLNEVNIECSAPTIARCINRFFYTFKHITREPDGRNSDSTKSLRREYVHKFHSLQATHREHTYVFVEEVGFQVVMRPYYGRSLKRKRALTGVPRIRTRNISWCIAMTSRGVIHRSMAASTFNHDVFREFVKELFEVLPNTSS